MAGGVAAFREVVEAVAARAGPRRVGIIANEDGRLRGVDDDFVGPFVAQMTGMVRWVACLRTLAALAVREVVLVGPSKVLAALLHTNLGAQIDAGQLRVHRVEARRDLDQLTRVLR
jgi:malonyl CoA-acyl carrier protein transacylase